MSKYERTVKYARILRHLVNICHEIIEIYKIFTGKQ